MRSKAFFSMALISLFVLIGLCIVYSFSQKGRQVQNQTFSHIQTQMQLYQKSLKATLSSCLERYAFSQCQALEFALQGGYAGGIAVNAFEGDLYLVDFLVEYTHPMTSQLIRETRREIWKIPNAES